MVYSASSVSGITGGEGKRPRSLNRTIRIMELMVVVVVVLEADDGLVWDPQESTVRRRKIVALAASRLSLRL